VVNWEPGAFIEAAAFDAHVGGRPRIDRIKVVFIADANTALASMLSGELHFAGPTALAIPQGRTLQEEWSASGARGGGTVIFQTFVWRGAYFQRLPGYTAPRALLDVRVRKALAHAVDRNALNEAISGGLAVEANYLLPPNGQWGAAVQQGAVRYGYDVRRTEQLMQEAGFEKGLDGVYVSPAEGRMSLDVRTTGGGTGPIELAAMASDWQKAGFEIEQKVVPAAISLDVETRMSYPSMEVTTNRASEATAVAPIPGNIPNPENRWRGPAQTSWTHPEYTRLVGLFTSTLDREERAGQIAQMARIFGDDVAAISLNFPPIVSAAASALSGPEGGPPETNVFWKIHEWELR
jgi:peptide/nickel transport system substrate-binding protein